MFDRHSTLLAAKLRTSFSIKGLPAIKCAGECNIPDGEIFTGANRKLPCIPGNVPTPNNLPKGCSFAPRCSKCMGKCMESMPELVDVGNGHQVRCWLYEKGAE